MSQNRSYKEIEIPIDLIVLRGNLRVAENSKGIILFSHGSGSSRMSSRNNFVANFLREQGFSSLLFDLLTELEDMDYSKRFDIELLKDRLIKVTKWVLEVDNLKEMPIGYFGSSTGAASALCAGAELGKTVKAIVSRGGRPDLAIHILEQIEIPTLLLVGGEDTAVIELNKIAKAKIRGMCNLKIIDGASHLFIEPGKLQEVAKHSAQWFETYLKA